MSNSLTNFLDFDPNHIRFGETFDGTYKKIIPIGIFHEDNINQLILSTPSNLLSFGVQEIRDKEKSNVIGYQLPICLWGKKKVSNEERIFTRKMEEMLSYIKEFLYTLKDEIDINDEMINNIQILNYKYENGKRCEDKGPILYTKLLMNNRTQKIVTTFIDDETKSEINPLTLLYNKGTVKSAIKIENIIIGKRIVIQVKLFEVLFKKLPTYSEKPRVKHSLLNPKIKLTFKKKNNTEIIPESEEKEPQPVDLQPLS